ncbi:IGR protein motif-domain-containing protein [Gigaspora margarita]|uniref:Small ribosomal subunit protein mS41 n=1 Tax=Gigaspora margarita TaxID=4874 RepID=A0A8H3ZZX4_GIGMA|nr:IGR protein motif-domain-containing protein [Gigaspora margarita]
MSFLCSILLNRSSFEIQISKVAFATFIFRQYSQNKQKSIPPPRGSITTHKEFLEKIGRDCGDLADKFRDWDHLFTASSQEMKDALELPTKQRRWILAWTQHYRDGLDPYNIPIRTKKKQKKK